MASTSAMRDGQMWVFGYGSLIWEPGFAHDLTEIATLDGYARSFCMRSIHHRGTAAAPGLVLALDRDAGQKCEGLAIRVAPEAEAVTLAYLRERELVSSAYLETTQMVRLRSGPVVEALTFVVDPDHVQYCGHLPLAEQAEIIAAARGGRGPNAEYLFNTCSHLAELGIHDPDLVWLGQRVRDILRR